MRESERSAERTPRFEYLPIALRGRLSTMVSSERRWVLPSFALTQSFSLLPPPRLAGAQRRPTAFRPIFLMKR